MSGQVMILVAGPCHPGTNDMVATGERLAKRIFRDLSEIPERIR